MPPGGEACATTAGGLISSGFWIGQTVATVDAWKRYRKAVGAPALPTADPYGRVDLNEAGGGDMPAVMMNWPQASAYCAWAWGQLPTEAQWRCSPRGWHSCALRRSG